MQAKAMKSYQIILTTKELDSLTQSMIKVMKIIRDLFQELINWISTQARPIQDSFLLTQFRTRAKSSMTLLQKE